MSIRLIFFVCASERVLGILHNISGLLRDQATLGIVHAGKLCPESDSKSSTSTLLLNRGRLECIRLHCVAQVSEVTSVAHRHKL
jgi:hypothetical protein